MPVQAVDRPIAALPGPFATAPRPDGVVPTAATRRLVDSQVDAILAAAPSFHQLAPPDQADLVRHMKHIASYAAELVRDDWFQSDRLGQRPVLRRRAVLEPRDPLPQNGSGGSVARTAAVAGWSPAARSLAATTAGSLAAPATGGPVGRGATTQVGTVTRQTLQAIAFPDFVADLIRSTFRAIVDSSIQQLDAIRALLGNVSGTVDEFEESNITDSQAREWLAQQYGSHLQLYGGQLSARPDAPETPPPWDKQLGLSKRVDLADAESLEEVLVPAARRKLSQGRLETLSLLVMMGIDRIVVTAGKIRATMAFHIDASDAVQEANASQFDLRVAAAGSVGFGPWSASLSTSVGYVTSSRTNVESEINVAADLTGEVELHFRSDPVQIQRMLGDDGISRVVANTPVPAANEAIPWGPSVDARAAVAPRRTSDPIQIAAPPPLLAPPPVPPREPATTPQQPARPGTPGQTGTPPPGGTAQPPAGSTTPPPGGTAQPPAGSTTPPPGGTAQPPANQPAAADPIAAAPTAR